jgi:site-specific recombinase XerD
MATIKVILKKEKVDSNGEMPLYLRITKDRKTNFISLGYKIKEKDWNEATSTVKKSHSNSARINNFITTKIAEAQGNAIEQETESKFIPAKSIKQAILGKSSVDFFDFTTAYIAKVKPRVSIGTIQHYEKFCDKIQNFLGKKSLMLNEITPLFLDNFENYMRVDCKNKNNTVHANFKILRRFILAAVNDELIPYDKNPFLKRKYSYEKTNIEFLTEEELTKLETVQFPDDSIKNHVRNIFVFACYAGGLRVSDLLTLKWSNFDGERLILSTIKTSTSVSIKLPSKAKEILSLYAPTKINDASLIFPFLKEVNLSKPEELYNGIAEITSIINNKLIQIGNDAKIEKHIHMHMSRHTFATRALKKGMRIEYVSNLLGHASIKTTQIYATIVNEDLDNAMDLLG